MQLFSNIFQKISGMRYLADSFYLISKISKQNFAYNSAMLKVV